MLIVDFAFLIAETGSAQSILEECTTYQLIVEFAVAMEPVTFPRHVNPADCGFFASRGDGNCESAFETCKAVVKIVRICAR